MLRLPPPPSPSETHHARQRTPLARPGSVVWVPWTSVAVCLVRLARARTGLGARAGGKERANGPAGAALCGTHSPRNPQSLRCVLRVQAGDGAHQRLGHVAGGALPASRPSTQRSSSAPPPAAAAAAVAAVAGPWRGAPAGPAARVAAAHRRARRRRGELAGGLGGARAGSRPGHAAGGAGGSVRREEGGGERGSSVGSRGRRAACACPPTLPPAPRSLTPQDAGIPLHYQNHSRAVHELTHSAVLVDLSHWGRLRLSGPDRLRFLHGQSTAELTGLAPGQGCDTVRGGGGGRGGGGRRRVRVWFCPGGSARLARRHAALARAVCVAAPPPPPPPPPPRKTHRCLSPPRRAASTWPRCWRRRAARSC